EGRAYAVTVKVAKATRWLVTPCARIVCRPRVAPTGTVTLFVKPPETSVVAVPIRVFDVLVPLWFTKKIPTDSEAPNPVPVTTVVDPALPELGLSEMCCVVVALATLTPTPSARTVNMDTARIALAVPRIVCMGHLLLLGIPTLGWR